MPKYKVTVTATCLASVWVRTDSPEEALEKAQEEIELNDESDYEEFEHSAHLVEDELGNVLIEDGLQRH